MVLYLAADLLWGTKIKSTADAVGVPCRPVRNLEMLDARLKDSPVKALMLDLEAGAAEGQETAFTLLKRVRETGPAGEAGGARVRVLVFGPHVMVEALRRAKAEGADVVMARGALHGRLAEILQDLEGGAGAVDDAMEE